MGTQVLSFYRNYYYLLRRMARSNSSGRRMLIAIPLSYLFSPLAFTSSYLLIQWHNLPIVIAEIIRQCPSVIRQIIPNVRVRDIDANAAIVTPFTSVGCETTLEGTIEKLVGCAQVAWIEIPGTCSVLMMIIS